jgi:hypothetical protein
LIKQVLLAAVLVAVPVAGFTGFQVYARTTVVAAAGLGDLSSLKVIIADAQTLAAKGDLVGASKRITDWESAWDAGETAIRPLNQTYWGNIDQASDAALKALRAPKPLPDAVSKTLAALMAALNDPSKSA